MQTIDQFEDSLKICLWRRFQLQSYLPGQEAIVKHLHQGGSALVIRPTGGGKSLCFQLPGISREGTCLVISPLISLMIDQVQKLQERGIKAYALHSGISVREQAAIVKKLEQGLVEILYLSPERLCHASFDSILCTLKLSLIAFDEAHCLSLWGHEFRPLYLEAAKKVKQFDDVPKVALTASADYNTRREIIENLGIANAKVFVNSMDRPNLSIEHIQKKSDGLKQLLARIESISNSSGIIYCLSRRKCEEVAQLLQSKGLSCEAYHAGLPTPVRAKIQEAFLTNKLSIIVATIAFGMGIDKPDIRFVIHLDMPKNLEGYYQEIGRAGRDGRPAETVLFYSRSDKAILSSMIKTSTEDEVRQRVELFKLDSMEALCHAKGCKRKLLLLQFEDRGESQCANCSWCNNESSADLSLHDYGNFVLKVLQAVHESSNKRPLEWWLRHCSNHLEDFCPNSSEITNMGTYKSLKFLFHQMLIHGLVQLNLYGQVSLSQESISFLKSKHEFRVVEFPWKVATKKRRTKKNYTRKFH